MIQTFELMPGITLRCFTDRRFKQGCLSLQFIRPMDRKEAALNALIPAVLLRGCQKYPDMRDIILHLDDLYGAAAGAVVRRVGDYHTTGLSCNFIEDRFALEGDSVLAPVMSFIGQLLLEPVLENGIFLSRYVESEKRNLILTIESQLNDKRVYAANQMMDKMCAADSYSIPRLGHKEQVAQITPQSLYSHYRKILRESPLQLFYVGSAQPQVVAGLFRDLFRHLEREPIILPPQTGFRDGGKGEYTEHMDVAQGRLCMGFVSPITLHDRDFAAMQVFNTLFGAGMTSKLFMQVRETLSLCYDIGSAYYGSKGILTVAAGIDFHQERLVRQQVLEQLKACQQGQISHEELTSAKEAILSQLRSTHDSPGAIEGYYATAALSGLRLTPAEYMDAVEAVTAEDVARVSKTLEEHTVYFLRGESQ